MGISSRAALSCTRRCSSQPCSAEAVRACLSVCYEELLTVATRSGRGRAQVSLVAGVAAARKETDGQHEEGVSEGSRTRADDGGEYVCLRVPLSRLGLGGLMTSTGPGMSCPVHIMPSYDR